MATGSCRIASSFYGVVQNDHDHESIMYRTASAGVQMPCCNVSGIRLSGESL
jgi:hypothetical protein